MTNVKRKIENLRAKRLGAARPIAERMAAFVAEAASGKTYQQARDEILDYLRQQKWELSGPLKIPHATSPGGDLRLWFKAQAVYYTEGDRHSFGNARAVVYDLDIRKMTGPEFLKMLERMFPSAGLTL